MMMQQIASQAIEAKASYGTTGLKKWIQDNVVTLVIIIAGITVLWIARGGNISKGVTIVAGIFMGLGVLGLASGTNATDIGDFLVGLFKSGS